MWKIISKTLPDLFFPKRCFYCGRPGSSFCQDCLSLVEILPEDYCPFCRTKTISPLGATCYSHRKTHFLNGVISAVTYNQSIVKKAISLYKYPPFLQDLKESFLFLIIAHLKLTNNNISKDFNNFNILAIPSGKTKARFREFNPSLLLAGEISQEFGLPLVKNALIKIKKTCPQAKLSRELRFKNIQGAFAINKKYKNSVKGKNFLLIDDVFTTGSTMDEAARTLKANGAHKVWGLTLAREF